MRLSASVEYAARVLVQLGRLRPSESLSAEKLSASENIPRAYVDQIVQRLRRAGLVASHRGAHGGYVLSRPPEAVTLGMLVRAVDGGIFEDVCERYAEGDHQCSHLGGCNIRPVWLRLGRVVEGFLDGVTVRDLLEEAPTPACSGGVACGDGPPSAFASWEAARREGPGKTPPHGGRTPRDPKE